MFLQGQRPSNHAQTKAMLGFLSKTSELGDDDLDLPLVCFGDIVSATNNFSEENMLGQGGFGKVYKVTRTNKSSTKSQYHEIKLLVLIAQLKNDEILQGVLDDREVAIKRLGQGSGVWTRCRGIQK